MASPSTTFSQTVACKLDEKNYMNWHQQVKVVLRAHQLEKYVVNPVVPLKYLSEEDCAAGTINPEFTNWDRQDALIMSWLLSTLSDSILSRVVTCYHSFQVWNTIHSHFHGLTRARTTQLRLELRTIKKGTKSCSEYLQRIQQLCDTLTATGDAISNREQTNGILGGLPPEYEALISTVTAFLTRDADVSVLDIETMILAHEARLEQHKQTALQEPLTLNLAESTSAPHSVPTNSPENHVVANYISAQGAAIANSTPFSSNQNQYSSQGNFSANGSGYGRGQSRGRGAQGRGGQVQCQICKKRGHEASTCYHRSVVAPFGNFGAPYSFFGPSFSGPSFSHIGPYDFGPQHSFAPPNFGAPQFFGNMQQPHFANGPTPTSWMPYSPGPHFHNPVPPFGYQPTVPPNNGTTLQQQQIPPTANISQAWFPDSGASYHATNDPHNLLQSSEAAGNEHILMANGTEFT